ncbi:hypothetical protein MRB53_011133 [Persea americana]|uniref:Uncharacterized protein n=1 Tax=Persea americana TaxID=3435 RepID=A0ACC2LTP1_PERAE|nr:hypothetical protein MRB53_011133 [Persea americana]
MGKNKEELKEKLRKNGERMKLGLEGDGGGEESHSGVEGDDEESHSGGDGVRHWCGLGWSSVQVKMEFSQVEDEIAKLPDILRV